MEIKLKLNTSNIDWKQVVDVLKIVGMGYHTPEIHQKAFENSYAVVFVFDDSEMIGFGRALSDGAYQAAIYDVAVMPSHQGKGIGKLIVEKLIERCPDCNYILYASPGKELFYQKMNFSKMKTGMALFRDAERKRDRGFID